MAKKEVVKKKQPLWDFTTKRQESMKKAQRVHRILVAIGKEYRNKAIKRAKYRRLLGKGGKSGK